MLRLPGPSDNGEVVFTYDGNGERVYDAGPSGVTAEPFTFYQEKSIRPVRAALRAFG